jgi:hypothetical protein
LVSDVRTVGHDEQSLSAMTGPHFGRTENSCRNAVAQSFQCRDEHPELSVSVPRHVFAEDTLRPALRDDANDLIKQEAVVSLPLPLSGDRVGLARIAASDAIHDATPRSSVETGKIRPDRRVMKFLAFHSRNKIRDGMGFPLHVSDAARSGHGNADSELKPANPGT